MIAYLLRRLLLIIPTIFGILLLSFTLVQFAPGGPIERIMAQLQGNDTSAASRIGGESAAAQESSSYRGAQGLDPKIVKELEKQFGFDKPPVERFFTMVKNYLRFDFGKSYYRDISVVSLIKEKLPVSMTLGFFLLIIGYSISLPLGIAKAVKDGTPFDILTSTLIIIGYAIPSFLFAILLIVVFAGGSFFDVFPLRGLFSDNFASLSPWGKVKDYLWHITLPILAMVISIFATKTLLTKNAFIDEIKKQYVLTARAKGLSENAVLYKHVFRNAMLVVIAGFPAAFVHAFFTGSLLIETIFSLDGLGLLSFESIINRDYPVVFANLYIFALIGLVVNLLSDILTMWIDPRIDFEARS